MSDDESTTRHSSLGTTTTISIPVLTPETYQPWAIKMINGYRMMGVWQIVSGKKKRPELTPPPVKQEGKEAPDNRAQEDRERKAQEVWDDKDEKAIAALFNCMREDLHDVITPEMTSHQAWEAIKAKYEKQSMTGTYSTFDTMLEKKYANGESMSEHINSFRQNNLRLKNTTLYQSDDALAYLLLRSLPQDWEPVRMTITTQSRKGTTFTFDDVAALLREQAQQRRLTGIGSASNPIALVNSNRAGGKQQQSKLKCTHCGMTNHTVDKCYELVGYPKGHKLYNKQPNNKQAAHVTTIPTQEEEDDADFSMCCRTVDDNNQAAIVDESVLSVHTTVRKESSTTGGTYTVTLDSGATCHLWQDGSSLINYRTVTGRNVEMGDGRRIPIAGVGSLRISTQCGKVTATALIHNVYHVPGMAYNLISIGRLDDAGYTARQGNGMCVIRSRSGRVAIIAHKEKTGQLYQTTVTIQPRASKGTPAALTAVATQDVPVSTNPAPVQLTAAAMWHARLGHSNSATVYKLFKHGMVRGVDCEGIARSIRNSGPSLPAECESCEIGKSHRQPFTGQAERATRPLEILHTDICGPIPDTGLSGARYLFTITDDYTRYVFVAVTAYKDGATIGPIIRDWVTWAENQHSAAGHKVRIIRSDNGGEYVNDALQTWMRERGIGQQLTTPHTPQLNGVSERFNRTVMEKVRAMLHQSGLPRRFWTEAAKTAAYLHNRLPHRSLPANTTPYTLWYGKPPPVDHLRPFGCIAFCHVPSKTRTKLDPKATLCVMVGYSTTTKAYRLWDPSSWHSHLIESRDVDWREWQYWGALPKAAGRGGTGSDSSSSHVSEPPTDHTNINGTLPTLNDDEQDEDEDEPADGKGINPSPAAPPRLTREQRGLVDFLAPGQKDQAPSVLGSRLAGTQPTALGLSATTMSQDDPRSYKEAMSRSDAMQWTGSMQSEIDQLDKTGTWELVVPPPSSNIIGCKWVYKVKTLADGSVKYKSRLVAQGFTQKPGVDYDETYSPVVRYATLRCLFALAAHYDWEVHHMDVKSAYLNGKLEETIYMRQPEGYTKPGQEHLVCQLKKGLYGLKQAGRTWHQTIDPALKQLGLTPLNNDYCVYIHRAGKEMIIISLYVDDLFLFTSSPALLRQFKQGLMDRFEMEDLGEARLVLGMHITRNRSARTLTISQQSYLEKALSRLGAADMNAVATPIDANAQLVKAPATYKATTDATTRYQSIIGTLQYAANGTRPDIAYAVNQLAQYSSNPDDTHLTALKRILRYVRGTTNRVLTYTGTKEQQPQLIGYSDADYANNKDDRRSVTGYAFLLCGGAISWASLLERVKGV